MFPLPPQRPSRPSRGSQSLVDAVIRMVRRSQPAAGRAAHQRRPGSKHRLALFLVLSLTSCANVSGAWAHGAAALFSRSTNFYFCSRRTPPPFAQVAKAAPLPLPNDGAEKVDAFARWNANPLLPPADVVKNLESLKANPLPPLDDDGVKTVETWIDPLIKAAELSLMADAGRRHAGVSLGANDGLPMGAAIDASYSPMRGNLTCYTDDVGHVVALGFNTGFVCSPTANEQVIPLSDADKVTGLAVAYSPKTGKVRK